MENVTENGVTTTQKYGSNTILTRQNTAAGFEWEIITAAGEYLNAGLDWNQEKGISTVMYPYVMTNKLDIINFHVGFLFKFGPVDWRMNLNFSKGWDDDRSRKVNESVAVAGEPFRLNEYEERMTEWQARQKGVYDIALRYNFPKGVYIEAAAEIVSGLSKKKDGLLSGNRNTETLKIGYNF